MLTCCEVQPIMLCHSFPYLFNIERCAYSHIALRHRTPALNRIGRNARKQSTMKNYYSHYYLRGFAHSSAKARTVFVSSV